MQRKDVSDYNATGGMKNLNNLKVEAQQQYVMHNSAIHFGKEPNSPNRAAAFGVHKASAAQRSVNLKDNSDVASMLSSSRDIRKRGDGASSTDNFQA